MSWKAEFGPDYAVPERIVSTLHDQSWHNDIAPSFSHPLCPTTGDHDLRLWVEHPSPEMREYEEHRYTVSDCIEGTEYIHTDDLEAAMSVLEREAIRLAGQPTEPVEPSFDHLRDVLSRATSVIEEDDDADENGELVRELRTLTSWLDAVRFISNEVIFRNQ